MTKPSFSECGKNSLRNLILYNSGGKMNSYEADIADLRDTFDINYAHLGCDDLPTFQPYNLLEYVRWHSINVHNQFMPKQMTMEFRTTNCQNRLQGIVGFKKHYHKNVKRFLSTNWITNLLDNDSTIKLTIFDYYMPQIVKDKALEQLNSDTDPIGSFYQNIDMGDAVPFTIRST